MHPLDGAYIRVDRAEEHLTNLNESIMAFINREYERTRAVRSLDPQPPPMGFHRVDSPIPLMFSVLVGEAIYNLRAALDYFVYELAALDSGTPQKGTQFPIESTLEGFRGRCKPKGFLGGISPAHTTDIERLQPYNGVEWTKQLAAISNPDKHRHLTVLSHARSLGTTKSPDPAEAAITADDVGVIFVYAVPMPDGTNMNMKFHFTFFITFEDGLPVIDTLEKIKLKVADTLADFKAKF